MERRLGRGLDSLISKTVVPDTPAPAARPASPDSEPAVPRSVSLDSIRVNPDQPRQVMSETALAGLAQSIRQHGVLQPLVVRARDGGYELVAGERRFRASRIAGLAEVPIVLVEAEGPRSLELALIENIQRENLGPMEEADAYEELLDKTGWTHQELAEHMGKSRAAITNALRLRDLPDVVQGFVRAGRLSAGQARAMVGAPDPEALAQQAVDEALTVRQVEERARQLKAPELPDTPKVASKPNKLRRSGSPKIKSYEEQLRNLYGTKVSIASDESGGEIRFEFYSDDDRDRLIHQLLTGEE